MAGKSCGSEKLPRKIILKDQDRSKREEGFKAKVASASAKVLLMTGVQQSV